MKDAAHKREYDSIRIDHPEIPLWEDLTESQKEKVREENIRYWNELNEFGKVLSSK